MVGVASGRVAESGAPGEPVVAVRVYGLFGSIALTGVCMLASYAGAFVTGLLASIVWSLIIAPVLMSQADFGAALMSGEPDAMLAPYDARGFVEVVGHIGAAIAGILALRMVVSERALHARDYLGPLRISARHAALYAPVMAVLLFVPLCILLAWSPETSAFPRELESCRITCRFPGVAILAGAGSVVLMPSFEELLFRGFLYRGLARSRLGVVGAILITALLWAALHYNRPLGGLIQVFAMGLLFGWVRHKTDSVALPITMHMFFNLFLFVPAAFIAYHGG